MGQCLRLQASLFGNFGSLFSNQSINKKLYDYFHDEKFVISSVLLENASTPSLLNRPFFFKEDNSISVIVNDFRVDISSEAGASAKELNLNEFVDLAKIYLTKILELTGEKASRISLVSSDIYAFCDEDKAKEIENAYIQKDKLINPNNLFEWVNRSVTTDEWTINGKKEKVNLNVSVMRQKLNRNNGEIIETKDAIVLSQDLNTRAENIIPRLDAKAIECFYSTAIEKAKEIESVVEHK